jgi:hypothetical protein
VKRCYEAQNSLNNIQEFSPRLEGNTRRLHGKKLSVNDTEKNIFCLSKESPDTRKYVYCEENGGNLVICYVKANGTYILRVITTMV